MSYPNPLTIRTFAPGSSSLSDPINEIEVDENGKDEMEVNGSTLLKPVSLINGLSTEILHKIFEYAAGAGKEGDQRSLCAIRQVCTLWHQLTDQALFSLYWERLGTTQLPQLLGIFNQTQEMANQEEISYFNRFTMLTQKLRENGALIPYNQGMLGVQSSSYEQQQRVLEDRALKTVWKKIRGQIQKQTHYQVPLPNEDAAAIRAWLNNKDNAFFINQITKLDLTYLKLKTLPPEIGYFKQLKELHLQENQLTALPEWFRNFTRLEQLFIDDNKLTALPEWIESLSNLTWITLENNQLKDLPESFCNLRQLKSIQLRNNQLRALPESFGNLTKLTEICLDRNQLTALPQSLCNLADLGYLAINWNQLRALPESICKLSELRHLQLGDNKLAALPESIGNLTQLKDLYLAANQLRALPESIGNLTQLTHLQLQDNKLAALPESFDNLTELTELSLARNQLTALPESIVNLKKLRSICLNSNPLLFSLNRHLSEIQRGFERMGTIVEKQISCANYNCQTTLAALCQGIHRGESFEELMHKFEELTDEMKLKINRQQQRVASCISEAPCTDKLLLILSILNVLNQKFSELSEDKKKLVYRNIAMLAGELEGGQTWGEKHAEENIIRLIDAMELLHLTADK